MPKNPIEPGSWNAPLLRVVGDERRKGPVEGKRGLDGAARHFNENKCAGGGTFESKEARLARAGRRARENSPK